MSLALGVGAAALLCAVLAAPYFRRRPSALELERRRVAAIDAYGKIADGNLLDAQGNSLIYSYRIGGVEYTAAQDMTFMEQRIPADRDACMGPVNLKYDPRNPANSMLISEAWSGLRVHQLQKEKS